MDLRGASELPLNHTSWFPAILRSNCHPLLQPIMCSASLISVFGSYPMSLALIPDHPRQLSIVNGVTRFNAGLVLPAVPLRDFSMGAEGERPVTSAISRGGDGRDVRAGLGWAASLRRGEKVLVWDLCGWRFCRLEQRMVNSNSKTPVSGIYLFMQSDDYLYKCN